MMSADKRYFFDTASFSLESELCAYFRENGAIALDLGSSIYISSDKVAALVSQLFRNKQESVQSRDLDQTEETQKLAGYEFENRRLSDEMSTLKSQLKTSLANFQSAKVSLEEGSSIISSLKSENMQLRASISRTSSSVQAQDKPAQKAESGPSSELAVLRSQHADAIASLKVLEEENEELRKELDSLRPAGVPAMRLYSST